MDPYLHTLTLPTSSLPCRPRCLWCSYLNVMNMACIWQVMDCGLDTHSQPESIFAVAKKTRTTTVLFMLLSDICVYNPIDKSVLCALLPRISIIRLPPPRSFTTAPKSAYFSIYLKRRALHKYKLLSEYKFPRSSRAEFYRILWHRKAPFSALYLLTKQRLANRANWPDCCTKRCPTIIARFDIALNGAALKQGNAPPRIESSQ